MKNLLKKIKTRSSGKGGFTLIEVLVAIAISGIVMAGIYSAYYSQQRSYLIQEDVAVAQQNLRMAMYFMEMEVRMAACDPSENAGAAIINPGANTLEFSEDIGGSSMGTSNGVIDAGENITYALSGTNLTRDAGSGPQIIAENIQNLQFSYFNIDGDRIGQPIGANAIAYIRSIQINMTARVNNQTRVLTSRVKCRNIGLE